MMTRSVPAPAAPQQAGVVSLAACMLFTLRGRIGSRTVLPAAGGGGSSAALGGPKNQ